MPDLVNLIFDFVYLLPPIPPIRHKSNGGDNDYQDFLPSLIPAIYNLALLAIYVKILPI